MWRRSGVLFVDRCTSGVFNGGTTRLHPHYGSDKATKKSTPEPLVSSWRPSRAIKWVISNAMPLAMCQLFIEASFTGVCSWMLLKGKTTGDSIKAWLQSCCYPFTGLVDWDGGHHAEGWTVVGHHFDAETLTALHKGHNIVSGLLPLQLLVLALIFPLWMRAITTATAADAPLMMCLMRARRFFTGTAVGGHAATCGDAAKPASCHPFGKRGRHHR